MALLPIVQQGNASEKKVAITFDDGPNPYATPQILDILKQENCKASFFLVGRWAEKHPDIVLRTIAEGHLVGGHTYLHGGNDRSKSYSEFIKGNQAIETVTGSPIRYVRVPQFGYDRIDNGVPRITELVGNLKEKIDSHEMIVVGANLIPNDWNYSVLPEMIVSGVLDNLANGSIIDLHDSSEKEHEIKDRANRTVQVLGEIIRGIRAKGFEPVSLDEMNLVFTNVSVSI
ncbi:MAG: polysaccharide deacetylase family protein [Patescibacteria group bacterium]